MKCLLDNNGNCTCGTAPDILGLPVKKIGGCSVCSSNSNIIACKGCQTLYCYLCVASKELTGCCAWIRKNLENEYTECPGCLGITRFCDIVPLKCQEHELLCKKCWNLGVACGKCIFGCELACKAGFYCHCNSCDKNEIQFFGEFYCPNCQVCDVCQNRYMIFNEQARDPYKCVNCDRDLSRHQADAEP